MGTKTNISWCDATWNIARGCTKVDEDCKYCYMYRDSFDSTRYNPLNVVRTKGVFTMPLKLKEPSKIFTSSLTDFFHPAIDSYRGEAWDIIRRCPQHTFQILTKRPERIFNHLPSFWQEINYQCWLGTSVGSGAAYQRIMDLLMLRPVADTLFLSLEPLHGPIEFRKDQLQQFDWVIVGGESGNETGKYKYRPCKLEWIGSLVEQCKEAGVPVFVKQLGTALSKQLHLSDRHGGIMEEWPLNLQVREFPLIANPF